MRSASCCEWSRRHGASSRSSTPTSQPTAAVGFRLSWYNSLNLLVLALTLHSRLQRALHWRLL